MNMTAEMTDGPRTLTPEQSNLSIIRILLTLLAALLSLNLATAQDLTPNLPEGYINASEILELPEFIPSVGSLYIDPGNAPVRPWLAYGRDGQLVEVLFMVPLNELTNNTNWTNLATNLFGQMDFGAFNHVDITFNGGHPGMAEPHYHIRFVLLSDEAQQAALSE